ncbi:hypothetical protein [Vannielia sp. SX4]|uniref:hypothetical protein n=1 Tax=Vannielia sp. SX4 TaxID=3463852 RepID=UPI0040599A92
MLFLCLHPAKPTLRALASVLAVSAPSAALAEDCVALAALTGQLCPAPAFAPGSITDPSFIEMQPAGPFGDMPEGYAVLTPMTPQDGASAAATAEAWLAKVRSKDPESLPRLAQRDVDGRKAQILDASGEGRIGRIALIEDPGAGVAMLSLSAAGTAAPDRVDAWADALLNALDFPGSS